MKRTIFAAISVIILAISSNAFAKVHDYQIESSYSDNGSVRVQMEIFGSRGADLQFIDEDREFIRTRAHYYGLRLDFVDVIYSGGMGVYLTITGDKRAVLNFVRFFNIRHYPHLKNFLNLDREH